MECYFQSDPDQEQETHFDKLTRRSRQDYANEMAEKGNFDHWMAK